MVGAFFPKNFLTCLSHSLTLGSEGHAWTNHQNNLLCKDCSRLQLEPQMELLVVYFIHLLATRRNHSLRSCNNGMYPFQVSQLNQRDFLKDMRKRDKKALTVGTPPPMTHGAHLYPDRPWSYPPKRTRGTHFYPGPPERSTRHSQASCPDNNISYRDILSGSLIISSKPC